LLLTNYTEYAYLRMRASNGTNPNSVATEREVSGGTDYAAVPTRSLNRRAILVFAESIELDLDRRGFPKSFRPLFDFGHLSAFASKTDLHLFTSHALVDQTAFKIHRQTGTTFGQRLESAVERVVQMGYSEIVLVGRDCPRLTSRDVSNAFDLLSNHRLVLGPDHRGGCYLIAFHSADRALLRDVRWNQNTDCAQLRNRGGTPHVFMLTVKHDLDSWADVRLFARTGDALARLATFLIRLVCRPGAAVRNFVDLAWHRVRVRQQIPPPAFAN